MQYTELEHAKMRRYWLQGYDCVVRDSRGNLCPGYRHDQIEDAVAELELLASLAPDR